MATTVTERKPEPRLEEQAIFQITGMTCAACANRIEKGLGRIARRDEATVNFALESASVRYLPGEVTVADLENKVKQLGYQATVKQEGAEDGDRRQREIRRLLRKFLISAVLSLPLLWTMVAHFSFTAWICVPDLFMNAWVQLVLATSRSIRDRRAVLYRRLQSASKRQRQYGCADRAGHVGGLFLQSVPHAGVALRRRRPHRGRTSIMKRARS